MIIQSRIEGKGLKNRSLLDRSLGAIGVWSVAILCGSIVAACSGTIETPTEEFPPRQGGSSQAQTDDDDDSPPRTPAPSNNNPPVASNNDDDEDPPVTPPADDEEDPAAEEDPPAADPPAGDLSFASDISSIFSASCGGCHGPGGFGGVSIADSDVDAALENARDVEDLVIQNIEAGDMPPPCGGGAPGDPGCMPADDFAAVEAWYEAGAPE